LPRNKPMNKKLNKQKKIKSLRKNLKVMTGRTQLNQELIKPLRKTKTQTLPKNLMKEMTLRRKSKFSPQRQQLPDKRTLRFLRAKRIKML